MNAHHAIGAQRAAIGQMAYAAPASGADSFSLRAAEIFAVKTALVRPNTDCDSRLQVEFLQDVLNVLLHRPRAAAKNLANLAIALPFSDPFYDLQLTLR
jgi:hypothetical protein